MAIDRDAFLKATFKRQPVKIEGLGEVFVREVTAAEAADYARMEAKADKDELANVAWLTIRVLCDDQGKPLLSHEDAPAVKALPLRYLKQIGKVAAQVSGWETAETGADPKKDGPQS